MCTLHVNGPGFQITPLKLNCAGVEWKADVIEFKQLVIECGIKFW